MSDPIIETPPPIEVEVVTGAATPLSADTPEDLGTAAAGVSMEASRSDHVHAMPSAADVGADPAGAASAVAGDLSTHENLTTSAHGGIVGDTDARLTDARTPLTHAHPTSQVTGLDLALAGKVDTSVLGVASGVATLGADGILTAAQRPPARHTPYTANKAYTMRGTPVSALVSPNAGQMTAHPVMLPPGTYNRLSVHLTAAAPAGYWRLGIYEAPQSGPATPGGALIAETADIDLTVAAEHVMTISTLTVPAGPALMFWVAVKCVSRTGYPKAWSWDDASHVIPPWEGAMIGAATYRMTWAMIYVAGGSGSAMPSTLGGGGGNFGDAAPQVKVWSTP